MKNMFFISLLVTAAFAQNSFAECRQTGSSFSRRNQDCEGQNISPDRQSYESHDYYTTYRGYGYSRGRQGMRSNAQEDYHYTNRSYSNMNELKTSPNQLLDRGYAAGNGSSFSMPSNK